MRASMTKTYALTESAINALVRESLKKPYEWRELVDVIYSLPLNEKRQIVEEVYKIKVVLKYES